jgi:hypothetical protein
MLSFLRNYYSEAFLGLVAILYFAKWLRTNPRPLDEVAERQLAYSSIKDSIAIAITASSILLPAIVAITAFILKGEIKFRPGADELISRHFFIAIIGYILCLFLGAFNLMRLPTQVGLKVNLAYERWTAIFGFLQGLSFIDAVFRTFCGFLVLV